MKILIVAGEPSGDLHSSNLITALRKLRPDVEIYGLGGHLMQEAGAKLSHNIADSAIIGFTEVLKKLKFFKKIFKELLDDVDRQRPDAVILVDFPGFNLRLAKALKQRGIPIIYYISPQVWAWGQKRIHSIKHLVDKMIVIFKFEKELYKKYDFDVDFVGHPLIETVHPSMEPAQAKDKFGISKGSRVIAIMPGSRKAEVKKLLPAMLKAAKIIKQNMPEVQFILPRSNTVDPVLFDSILEAESSLDIKIIDNCFYDCVNICDLALVASGTATLETAILQKPMVVIYKVSFFSWLISKALIKIPYIGLANVVAGEKIVPELIQFDVTPEKISSHALRILQSPEILSSTKQNLSKIKDALGEPGASLAAAKSVLEFLK